ncbi:unnamed protein product [Phytophthora lilii]|uniref:Unnamed protein product n=1 Tax=Phytophthora lilii TaxID=2077276 RepID=A0A9W6WZ20_9STRA|nr:unnamed protein product [Phytophthora lilii]
MQIRSSALSFRSSGSSGSSRGVGAAASRRRGAATLEMLEISGWSRFPGLSAHRHGPALKWFRVDGDYPSTPSSSSVHRSTRASGERLTSTIRLLFQEVLMLAANGQGCHIHLALSNTVVYHSSCVAMDGARSVAVAPQPAVQDGSDIPRQHSSVSETYEELRWPHEFQMRAAVGQRGSSLLRNVREFAVIAPLSLDIWMSIATNFLSASDGSVPGHTSHTIAGGPTDRVDAIEAGGRRRYRKLCFWCRHALTIATTVMCAEAQAWIPEISLTTKKAATISLVSAVLHMMAQLAIAELWAFPIPFFAVLGTPLLLIILAVVTRNGRAQRTPSFLTASSAGGSPELLSTLVLTTLKLLRVPGQLDPAELREIRLLSGMQHKLSDANCALLQSLAARCVYNNDRRISQAISMGQMKSRHASAAIEGRVLSASHFAVQPPPPSRLAQRIRAALRAIPTQTIGSGIGSGLGSFPSFRSSSRDKSNSKTDSGTDSLSRLPSVPGIAKLVKASSRWISERTASPKKLPPLEIAMLDPDTPQLSCVR